MKHWHGRGPLAWSLRPLAALYRTATALDRWRYRIGWSSVERLPVPVLVIGNWVAGGAGKTPTLLAILDLLRQWGLHPGVVSRGHGRQSQGVRVAQSDSSAADLGDEPLLIARRSGVPLAVASRRADAARALLVAHPEIDVIVSDDGLQHHALARDLAVWVFDRRGLGNGWLLPAGPLRQDGEHPPMPGSRSDHVVLYSDGVASTALPGFLALRSVNVAMPLAAWWQYKRTEALPLKSLPQHPWTACAGLAQPQAFFDMLRAQGLRLTAPMALPDHADFGTLPWPAGTPVLVTEKDAVKLLPDRAGCEQVWVVPLDLRPEPAFGMALRTALVPLMKASPWTPA